MRRRSQEPCRPGWQLLQVCVWQNNNRDDYNEDDGDEYEHTLLDQMMTTMMRWEPNSLTDSSHPVRRLSRGIGSEDQRRFLEAQSFSKWSQKRVGILKDFCVETLLEMVQGILVEEFGTCRKNRNKLS